MQLCVCVSLMPSTLTIRAITVKPTAETSSQSLKGDVALLVN